MELSTEMYLSNKLFIMPCVICNKIVSTTYIYIISNMYIHHLKKDLVVFTTCINIQAKFTENESCIITQFL